MTWEPVPWMVGGGASHSAEVGRVLAYNAAGGNEGILGTADLKVTQLGTPGASVQVAAGACTILARAAGQTYQAYNGRNPTVDTIGIAATGAGVPRSDLIVARVEDPFGDPGGGWATPSPVSDGPYIFTRVISGVPAGTKDVQSLGLGYTAIPLARIDVPASTSTITNAMIADLRKFARPRRESMVLTINPGVVAALTSASLINWIGAWAVTIPTWATQVVVTAVVSGPYVPRVSASVNGSANGTVRVILDHATLTDVVTQEVAYDLDVPFQSAYGRFTVGLGDTVQIPSALRGTPVTVRFQAKKSSGATSMTTDTATSAFVHLDFQELPS